MRHLALRTLAACGMAALWWLASPAQAGDRVVDIPTRPGVTQRMLYVEADAAPRAAAVLLPGGHGGLKLFANGSMGWGDQGLLVRTRTLFAHQGIAVLVLDAPSDKRTLSGFRDTAEHAADVGAAIAWLRAQMAQSLQPPQSQQPLVWLVGHSRGTESAVSATLKLGAAPAGPDGLVLASPISSESAFSAGHALTHFALEDLRLPVLVLQHAEDGCSVTVPADLARVTDRITGATRQSVVRLSGGRPVGDLCGHQATHGFGGLDAQAVQAMADFMQGAQR